VAQTRLPDGVSIDINAAPLTELMRPPGIGATLAHRIIENRPSAHLTDLLEADGIGPATYRRLEPMLRIAGPESGERP